MNIDLIMALVSLYQLSPEKRYLPLRLIIFTHALVYSTDFLIFVACIVWGFNQIHTRFQTASFASAPLIVLVGHLSSSVGHYLNDNMIMIF